MRLDIGGMAWGAATLALASGCGLSVSNGGDCAISGTAAGTGGSGGAQPSILVTSAGEGGSTPQTCDCPWPVNFDPSCHRLVLHLSGCAVESYANGEPCREGTGVCSAGICAAPNAVGQCIEEPEGPPFVACQNVGDCPSKLCAVALCPAPGCESCQYVPKQDGTACGAAGQTCTQGGCCDAKAGP